MQEPGGGPRILRALYGGRADDVVSICSSIEDSPPPDPFTEWRLPLRRHLGRIESTRANRVLTALDLARGPRFGRLLREACEEVGASAIHSVAHSVDFIYAR